jgi:hypothetical protein
VVSFPSHSKEAVSVFLEYSVRKIAKTRRAKKNPKTDSDSAHQNYARIIDFFQSTKICLVVKFEILKRNLEKVSK